MTSVKSALRSECNRGSWWGGSSSGIGSAIISFSFRMLQLLPSFLKGSAGLGIFYLNDALK